MFADILFPWPQGFVLTLHFTRRRTFHRILFYGKKTGSGETFCWHCCCYITINKDWQRNENNRNRFILLSTIHLLQLQWWFCLISILCVGESRTENQKPSDLFTNSFCHEIMGQKTLYKSGVFFREKVWINRPQLRFIEAVLDEGLMVWLWKYLFQSNSTRNGSYFTICDARILIFFVFWIWGK